MKVVLLTLAIGVGLGLVAAAADETSECLVCHGNNPQFSVRAPDGKLRSMYVDPTGFNQSKHAAKGCVACHGNLGVGPHSPLQPKLGDLDPRLQAMLRPRPPLVQITVAACMRCHQHEASVFVDSVHGQSAARGSRDVPLCNDCHGDHEITGKGDLESSVNPRNVVKTCARCHASSTVMARYDVKRNVVQTYGTSFHGEKRQLGEARAAVCTSCHGLHDIRAPQDPLSQVNPRNVAQTCGRCHKGATPEFAASFRHTVPSGATEPLIFWVSRFYMLAIYVTISGMMAFIVLDALRRRNQYPGSH